MGRRVNTLVPVREATAWVSIVNGSDEVHETWAYLLAFESVRSAAGSWEALRSGGQVYR